MRKLRFSNIFQLLNSQAKIQTQVSLTSELQFLTMFQAILLKKWLGNIYQKYFTIVWLWRTLISSNHPITADQIIQVLRYQKEMTHPWSDMATISFEVGRYSRSQRKSAAFAWWRGSGGEGGWVQSMSFDPAVSKNKNKKICEKSLCLKAEISALT